MIKAQEWMQCKNISAVCGNFFLKANSVWKISTGGSVLVSALAQAATSKNSRRELMRSRTTANKKANKFFKREVENNYRTISHKRNNVPN
jgi:hypothetical protein